MSVMDWLLYDNPHLDPTLREAINRQASELGNAMSWAAELALRRGMTPKEGARRFELMMWAGGEDERMESSRRGE